MVGDSEKGVADVFKVEPGAPLEPLADRPSRISVRWEQTIPESVGKIAGDGKGGMYGVDADNSRIIRIIDGAVAGEIKAKDFSPVSVAVDRSGSPWALDHKKTTGGK